MTSCKESRTHEHPHTHLDPLTHAEGKTKFIPPDSCPTSPRKVTTGLLPRRQRRQGDDSALSSGFGPGPEARDGQWGEPQLPVAALFAAPSELSLVAVDRQKTGPEGGGTDGGRRDRLGVVVVGGSGEN
jgi:hypothetical protein